MATERIKLPRSSYEELSKIIQAYGKSQTPAGLDDVSQLTGIGRTSISDNNAFLTSVGIIEGGKSKSATSNGHILAHALEHGIVDEIAHAWGVIVAENEFLTKVLQAIKIRKSMDENQLETHIAYSAGEAKTSPVMTGARAVIDILKASNLIIEDGGQIQPNTAVTEATPTKVETELPGASVVISPPIAPTSAKSTFSIQIQVTISATPSELDGLAQKLKALLRTLNTPDQPEDSNSK